MVSGIIEFSTSLGSVIMIRSVTITPKQKAVIKLLYAEDGMLEKHTLTMEGAAYQAWGNDDDYLGHFCISQLTNGMATIVGSDYVAATTTAPATSTPAKITTLEEQMVEQTRQLQQIRQIMMSNGMI